MPNRTPETHDPSHHHQGVSAASESRHKHYRDESEGTHVMPDGSVMKGAQHDNSAHGHHAPASSAHKGDPAQVEYTCPMHPQVRQMGPGNCPICGMALEPVIATAEQGESPELRDMTRRFWIGTLLTLPVFAMEMGGHLTNLSHLMGQQLSNWLQLVLGTPVVLWAGLAVLRARGGAR